MKKQSKILKMINLMVEAGAKFTPESKTGKGLLNDREGSDEIDKEYMGLWEEVDVPELYDHLCYGIYNPMKTQTSEY